jgi:hypothetical protein
MKSALRPKLSLIALVLVVNAPAWLAQHVAGAGERPPAAGTPSAWVSAECMHEIIKTKLTMNNSCKFSRRQQNGTKMKT